MTTLTSSAVADWAIRAAALADELAEAGLLEHRADHQDRHRRTRRAARIRLAELGYHPTLVAADGAVGLAEHAPFDRIIATCSVPAIPWPWIEQTQIGGVILTDIKVGLAAGNLVRLTRTDSNRAEGMFDAGQAAFMELRHTPGTAGRIPYARAPENAQLTESATTVDPRTPWANPERHTSPRIGGMFQFQSFTDHTGSRRLM